MSLRFHHAGLRASGMIEKGSATFGHELIKSKLVKITSKSRG
jgi:hypothetical protein